MRRTTAGWAVAGALLGASGGRAAPLPAAAFRERPNLVLVLVIDQFRADYLTRFERRLLPARSGTQVGGLRYLMEQGAFYFHAQYDNMQNMTGPGHATILTGAYPYQTGVPANDWYNSSSQQPVYCTEDAAMATVGVDQAKAHVGTSPRNLLATTVGDELKNAGYPSRVVSIALKDRAAILLGGHRADLALWIDQPQMRWVSSKFYLPEGHLPAWVEALNQQVKAHSGERYVWDKQGPGIGTSVDAGGAPTNVIGKEFNRVFPHTMKRGSLPTLASPLGVDMTESAAEQAISAYQLGTHAAADLLAASFSTHDYVGHSFGPNSREIEEITVAEDRSISKLLNHLQAKVPGGLKKVLIVLTADHGIPPNPEWASGHGIDAGRVDEVELVKGLEEQLARKYGSGTKWLSHVADLNFYLNKPAIAAKNLPLAEVEAEVKQYILTKNLAYAFTSSDYDNRRLPPGLIGRQILSTYYPGRSGDVVGLLKPFTITGVYGADHMTGYSYDRTVPVILAGPHIMPGVYPNTAGVVDIAPTLAFLLGIIPPSLAEGRVLSEAIGPAAR